MAAKRGTPSDPLGVVPSKRGRPVEETGAAVRRRKPPAPRPSKPKDIDDDRGRRPALTYGEWMGKGQPAPTVRASARVRRPRERNEPVTAPAGAGSVAPVTGPGGAVPGPSSASARIERRRRVDTRAAAAEASAYANRSAYMAAHGKPSVTGRAAGGAAGGAAAGASIGGLPGAAVGGVLGGAGGAVGGARAKRAYKVATRQPNPARKVLVAEFAVCAVIAAMAPLSDSKRDEAPGAWIKRMVALLGLFFVLGLVSAAGRPGAKVAAGFGGLVTVVLLVSQRDVFVKIAQIMANTDDKPAAGPGPTNLGNTQVDSTGMPGRKGATDLGNTQVDSTGTGGRKAVLRRVQ